MAMAVGRTPVHGEPLSLACECFIEAMQNEILQQELA